MGRPARAVSTGSRGDILGLMRETLRFRLSTGAKVAESTGALRKRTFVPGFAFSAYSTSMSRSDLPNAECSDVF